MRVVCEVGASKVMKLCCFLSRIWTWFVLRVDDALFQFSFSYVVEQSSILMFDAVSDMLEKKLQFCIVLKVNFAVLVVWPIAVFFGFEFSKAVKAPSFEVAAIFVATVVPSHPVDRELSIGYLQASQLSIMLFGLNAVSENDIEVDTPLHLKRMLWEVREQFSSVGWFESTHHTNIVLASCTLGLAIFVLPDRQWVVAALPSLIWILSASCCVPLKVLFGDELLACFALEVHSVHRLLFSWQVQIPQMIAQTGLDLSFVATSVELFGKPLEEKLLVMDAYWCMELPELLNKSSPCFMELWVDLKIPWPGSTLGGNNFLSGGGHRFNLVSYLFNLSP